MKTLYLLRHGHSSIANVNRDEDRVLSSKGVQEIADLAVSLQPKDFACDIVLCSSASRTSQTFEELAKFYAFNQPPVYMDEIYRASLDKLLLLIQNLNESLNSALIVGHNPTLSEAVEYLTGMPTYFGTANLACLSLNINSWTDLHKACADIEYFVPET
jgi:phosphohistidine phosphatase